MEITKSLFEKYICRVRTAHQPLKAPGGRKVYRNAKTPCTKAPARDQTSE